MGKTIDAWSAGSAAGKVGEHGARGLRLYYLSLHCRGGANRPRAGRAPPVRLRQHPSRHDLVLLVAGCGRTRGGSGDDREDPQLARRARELGGEGDAQLHHAGDPGDPARERRQGLSRLAHGGDRADGQGLGRGRLLAAMHSRLGLTLAASLAAALHLGATDTPDKPRRIVSLNLCVDELLLRLADPRNVARSERRQGLSRLAHGGDRADGQGLGRGRLLAAMHSRLGLTLAASLAAALHLGATDTPDKPRRIVSLNLCVDELLLRLADPRNVA